MVVYIIFSNILFFENSKKLWPTTIKKIDIGFHLMWNSTTTKTFSLKTDIFTYRVCLKLFKLFILSLSKEFSGVRFCVNYKIKKQKQKQEWTSQWTFFSLSRSLCVCARTLLSLSHSHTHNQNNNKKSLCGELYKCTTHNG